MIELFAANTPNGWKISIMLEEIGYQYKTTPVDIKNDEQFKAEFIRISPFSKIPVIIDHDNNKESVFESGAILMYLAEQSGKFHHYNPGKSDFGEERYFKIAKRIYQELDNRLKNSKFLAGNDYTIADIATWPWMARHEWHDIGLKNFKNLSKWYLEISDREAVIKGFRFMDKDAEIPLL